MLKVNVKKEVVHELNQILRAAVVKANFEGITVSQMEEWMESFLIEVPADEAHGDFATNIAMVGAKTIKLAPKLIAQKILENVSLEGSCFKRCEFAMPGFINFFLNNEWFHNVLNFILDRGCEFGKLSLGKGKKVIVEYVSANPTGPMHVGNARGGALGDCLAEILSWAGFKVQREFYLNDAGNQIEKFKKSLSLRYVNLFKNYDDFEMPPDSYQGSDIIELAKQFAQIYGDKFISCEEAVRQKALLEFALPNNVAALKSDLLKYRINYDVWFSESDLYKNNKILKVVEKLKQKGKTYEKDGAVWFNFTSCGGTKDEVLIRENSVPTYFAADIAYHYNKLVERKFDWAIDVWGADHHGHVARLKGALEILGIEPSKLEVVLMQLVRLVRDGKTVKLSKRSGKAITLNSLLDEVSVDAARFFFNLREANSHFDFDLDLAVSQTNNNPVYYVQYAYARICQLFKKAAMCEGLITSYNNLNYEFCEMERGLIKELVNFEEEIELAVSGLNSSIIAKFVINLATKFHKFYSSFRIIGESSDVFKLRLKICLAVKQVLFNAFQILKIQARSKF